jgi:transposase
MTYSMASLIKKTIRGKTYYYARECRRVDGRPKIVWQKYLGRADQIIAALTQPATPQATPAEKAVIAEFGATVALYDLAQRLRLVELIDRHVAARRGPHGPSVGHYLLLAALNRCLDPRSKAQIAAWYQRSALRRLLDFRPEQLTSQRFWNQMDRITPRALVAIERDLTAHLIPEFALDVRQVLFDATNFFTFIDTFNQRCTLAQRGHSKEGRAALRIVGLALLVTTDFHIPLCHHTYPGNQADGPTFAGLTAQLIQRHQVLSTQVQDITLVFDKGNNSRDNLQAVDSSPYHFIGSLVPSQHPELLALPLQDFHSLAADGLPGVSAYRTTKTVFGTPRVIVVTYNQKLFVAQSRTLLRAIAKRQRLLGELQARLQRWQTGQVKGGKPPTLAGTRKKVQGWLARRDLNDLFEVNVTRVKDLPVLSYRLREEAWQQLQATRLGQTILFTDHDDWTDAEVVRGDRNQHHVEAAFREWKEVKRLSLRPQRHGTDQKIQVHVFYCVLALLLCSRLRRELDRRGIRRSLPALLEELSQIREVCVVYPAAVSGAEPTIEITMSEMTEEQCVLYQALDLGRYRRA